MSRITPAEAAQALAGVAKRDPRGITTAHDMREFAKRGYCFELVASSGERVVYLMLFENGQAWVQAAQSSSGAFDFGAVLSGVIEAQAEGCHSVAFQTARRGLVRKAQKLGWEVAGWILKKDLKK